MKRRDAAEACVNMENESCFIRKGALTLIQRLFGKRQAVKRRRSFNVNPVAACIERLEDRALLSTIALHSGNTDPATEGWTYVTSPGSVVSTGPVTNDRGTGTDAWFVDDSGMTPDVDNGNYQTVFTSNQITDAFTQGWRMSANLRAVYTAGEGGGTLSDSISMIFNSGDKVFAVNIVGQEGNPDVTLYLEDGASGLPISLPGIGDGYHLYEMEFDPQAASATVLVDGIARLTGFSGADSAAPAQFRFGSTDTRDSGRGNYNLVEFEIFDSPTTVDIDIKPSSDTNPINLGSNGNVPVAILSTAEFDATTVDPTTVTLADAAVEVKGNGTSMASQQDINGDGLLDLVVHVSTQGLNLTAGDVEAVLEGETTDGQHIRGADSVRVIEGLLASGVGDGGLGTPLTSAALSPLLGQAVSHWASTGADVTPLANVDVRIEDLPDNYLGQAGDGVVWIDSNAAGWGWSTGDNGLSGGVDLLTVVSHELGHELGFDHSDDRNDVMAAVLPAGMRQLAMDNDAPVTSTRPGNADAGPVVLFATSGAVANDDRPQPHVAPMVASVDNDDSDLLARSSADNVEIVSSLPAFPEGSEDEVATDSLFADVNGSLVDELFAV